MAKRFFKGEVATRANNPFNRSLSDLLRPQSQRNHELLKDSKIIECLDALVNEIVSHELLVMPVVPEDQEVADFIKNELDALGEDQGLEELVYSMATAKITGLAVQEIMWEQRKDKRIVATAVNPKDFRRIEYWEKPGGLQPSLYTGFRGFEALPPRKFIISRYWAVPNEDPYGYGLGAILEPFVNWRSRILDKWEDAANNLTEPTKVGTYPAIASEAEILQFNSFVKSLAQHKRITLPEGFDITFVQAPTAGVEILDRMFSICDSVISQIVLGETTAGRETAGSAAQDYVSVSLRNRKAQSLSRSICKTLRLTLVRWLTELNFPDAEPPLLKFDFDSEKPEVLLAALKSLKELGFETTEEYVNQKFEIPLTKV